jgi:hypothetical protein
MTGGKDPYMPEGSEGLDVSVAKRKSPRSSDVAPEITAWLRQPLLGVDPDSGMEFLSERHVVRATSIIQDPSETSLVDSDGAVVALWPTESLRRIEWNQYGSRVVAGSKEWRDKIQASHPNAYGPWSTEEDERLRAELDSGLSIVKIAKAHRRRAGGIRARIAKLGLG